MTLLIILALNIAILGAITWAFSRRSQNLSSEATNARGAKNAFEQKFSQLRSELSALKEDNARKNKQLEELRENAKRKLKKEVTLMTETQNPIAPSANVQSFDLAIKTVQQQAEQAHQEEMLKLKAHYEERMGKLESQLGVRKQQVEKSKKNVASQVTVSLEGLPEEAVLEMGRLVKRSENSEKLCSAVRGKLQMSQERFSELQKRYFGVCRELALASGQQLVGITDEEIRNQAEDLLIVSDKEVQA